jgi:hypothetical protein
MDFSCTPSGVPAATKVHVGFVCTWPSVEVSATGIVVGGHEAVVDENGTFFGIGIDKSSYVSSPVGSGLVLGLPLHHAALSSSSFTSVDSSGSVCSAVSPVWGSQGRVFDGIDDIVTLPVEDFHVGNHTVLVWIKVSDFTSYPHIISTNDSTWRYIRFNNDGSHIRIENYDDTDNAVLTYAFSTNTWYFIAIPYDGAFEYLYVDGTYKASDAMVNGNYFNRIGGCGGRFLPGTVGDFFLYDRCLTASEIQQVYQTTKWRYDGTVAAGEASESYYNYVFCNTSVPDTSSSWVVGSNSTAYVSYFRHYVGGVITDWYQPVTIYNGGLSDRSGSGNTGTVNWGANPAGIEVTVGAITSYASTTASSTNTTLPDVVSHIITPITMAEDPAAPVSGMPQYDLVHRTAVKLGWTDQFMYIVMFSVLAIAIGFAGLVLLNTIWGFVIGFGATELLGVTAIGGVGSGINLVPAGLTMLVVLVVIFITWLWGRQ